MGHQLESTAVPWDGLGQGEQLNSQGCRDLLLHGRRCHHNRWTSRLPSPSLGVLSPRIPISCSSWERWWDEAEHPPCPAIHLVRPG